MKKIWPTAAIFLGTVMSNPAYCSDINTLPETHHHHSFGPMDMRTSLGMSAEMKQHQLSNMREHVAAIRSIIGMMSENKFEEASKIAHAKLGLTPEMQQMCSMFNNEKFMTLGLAFHKSGDELGDTLSTGDANASLRALNKTMTYCVECHANFRQ